MTQSIQRSIFRWIHIIFSIPIMGCVYTPFDKIPLYANATASLNAKGGYLHTG